LPVRVARFLPEYVGELGGGRLPAVGSTTRCPSAVVCAATTNAVVNSGSALTAACSVAGSSELVPK
jgi:hypothetical protein